LELRQDRALGDGVRAGLVKVVHLDVEVQHHQLLARGARPGRPHVELLGLERQGKTTCGFILTLQGIRSVCGS
jgi:hypothetical protein